MSEDEIKSKILEVFESERNSPGLDFEESRFMDFLTSPPKKNLKNSFRGARKYYRFMDSIEYEFGICFSYADLDKTYSVNKLTKKVIARIKKKKGNNMVLKRRKEENGKEKYYLEIVLLLILAGQFYWLGIGWTTILTSIFFGMIIYWIVSSKIYSLKQSKRMTERLKK
tara:strand:+ start:1100 stop:1606 length:507 start_codon:yes stop_codon:yes gene_type:complete